MGLFIVFFVIPLLAAFLLPSLASTGKPTLKQLAYRGCLTYVRFVNSAATNNQFTLDVSKLFNKKTPSSYQSYGLLHLIFSADNLAKRGEDYFIKTNCNTAKTNREIIVVCEKPFD